MEIIWVGSKNVHKVWPLVEHYVERSLRRYVPIYRTSDLYENVKNEKMQLWVVADEKNKEIHGACLTQIDVYPLTKMLHIFLLGGKNMKKWRDQYVAKMEEFAKSEGIEIIQAIGRKGWVDFPGAFETGSVVNKILR